MLQYNGLLVIFEDQIFIVFVCFMEGGQEDEEICRDFDELIKFFNDDVEMWEKDKSYKSICFVIDVDCVDIMFCYFDMCQFDIVCGYVMFFIFVYFKVVGEDGFVVFLIFFFDCVG